MASWSFQLHTAFRGLRPHAPFLMRLCRRRAPMRLDSRAAGRVGEKYFSSPVTAILFDSFRGFQPRTLSYFLLVQKVTKNTFKGEGVSTPPPP